MTERHPTEELNIDSFFNNSYINEIVFITLIILCFIGDVLGEFSSHAGIIYWLLLTPVFFLCSVIIEKAQFSKTKKMGKNMYFGLICWGSAFISVLLILYLWHAGALAAETVGILIHVILAHTMFVTGIILGFRFYLIGLFLFILAGFTIALEGAVTVALMFAIPLTIISVYLKKNNFIPQLKGNYNELFSDTKPAFEFLKHLPGLR